MFTREKSHSRRSEAVDTGAGTACFMRKPTPSRAACGPGSNISARLQRTRRILPSSRKYRCRGSCWREKASGEFLIEPGAPGGDRMSTGVLARKSGRWLMQTTSGQVIAELIKFLNRPCKTNTWPPAFYLSFCCWPSELGNHQHSRATQKNSHFAANCSVALSPKWLHIPGGFLQIALVLTYRTMQVPRRAQDGPAKKEAAGGR
jgi:hypothetical protein